jgi:tagaturonate reductase
VQKLNKSLLENVAVFPEKVLQFGEGNFLRAFVDWQIQVLNEKTDFNGSVVVVQPRGSDKIERLNNQDGLFTLYLQGIKDGKSVNEHMVIQSISRGINLFSDYQDYVELAGKPELRFIISNTTEAGIVFHPEDRLEDRPQKSFTGKLTAFLYHRFQAFSGDNNRGCILIPCELIENNGQKLKEVVLQYAQHWDLGSDFIDWIHDANTFCSSLVDRIVPGFPKDSVVEKTTELGYQDDLMVVGEQYHLWVIEGPEWIKDELPVEGTGLNTLVVDDLTPYRVRKVRILNGAHTAMTPVAYLYGLDTVEESVNDSEIGPFIKELIEEEIIQTLDGPREELVTFSKEVLARFMNPYIKHYLLSISLNSISKFTTRNLPAFLDYLKLNNRLPERMTFALSCLLYFYKGKRGEEEIPLQDSPEILSLLTNTWRKYENRELEMKDVAEALLANNQLWGMDLSSIPNMVSVVTSNLLTIDQKGVNESVRELNMVQRGIANEEFHANK